MSVRDIRTELLYNQGDRIRCMILNKRLAQLEAKKKEKINKGKQMEVKMTSVNTKPVTDMEQPDQPSTSDYERMMSDEDIFRELASSGFYANETTPKNEQRRPEQRQRMDRFRQGQGQRHNQNINQNDEDEDFSFLERFVGTPGMGDNCDSSAPEYDPRYETEISKDMMNNKMNERMNSNIDIISINKRRGKRRGGRMMGKNRPQQFISPFDTNTGSDEHASVNDPNLWVRRKDFTNQRFVKNGRLQF